MNAVARRPNAPQRGGRAVSTGSELGHFGTRRGYRPRAQTFRPDMSKVDASLREGTSLWARQATLSEFARRGAMDAPQAREAARLCVQVAVRGNVFRSRPARGGRMR